MNYRSIEGRDVLRRPLINSHSALTIPTYWRAMNYIADNLASFSHEVRDDDGPKLDHPLNKLLKRRPNQFQTGFAFRRALYFNAAHTGNRYSLIRRANPLIRAAANITGLYVLPSHEVRPFLTFDEGQEWFEGEKWFAYAGKVYPAEDMVHIHGLGYDGMMGWSGQQVLAESNASLGSDGFPASAVAP
ncbi:MAG TPA: phage portal protein [Tepidisphaeraceae bacterium]|jgi:phage portal protein BeeE